MVVLADRLSLLDYFEGKSKIDSVRITNLTEQVGVTDRLISNYRLEVRSYQETTDLQYQNRLSYERELGAANKKIKNQTRLRKLLLIGLGAVSFIAIIK